MYPEAKMIEPMKIWKLPDNKEYMLSEICESGEYFAQEKIDGYWYQFERTDNHSYLFSRNISVTTGFLTEKGENVPHIIDALSILPPNTITAAIYIGIPSLSPKYAKQAASIEFPKNPDINISALKFFDKFALIAPKTESKHANIATDI